MDEITNTDVGAETTSTESTGTTSYSNIKDATEAAVNDFSKPESQAATAPTPQDIAKLEKFLIEGKEYTYEQLKKERMLQADYTKKTQEYARYKKDAEPYVANKKFYDNLQYDLKQVYKDPALAAEFKKIYPESFHGYLPDSPEQKGVNPVDEQLSQLKKEFMSALDERTAGLDEIKKEKYEREVQVASLEIDKAFKEYGAKYDLHNEEQCLARLQLMLKSKQDEAKANGEDPRSVQVTSKEFEQVIKESHDLEKKRYEAYYAKQFNKQKESSLKVKSVGTGGGTPSGAPKQPRTIKEAMELAMNDPQLQ